MVKNIQLAGLHENEHRNKSGNTATQGSRSIFINDTHTRETEEGARGRETRDSYIQCYTKSKTSSFPTLERQILSRHFIHGVRGSAARVTEKEGSESITTRAVVGQSMGASAPANVGFHQRESSADQLQSTGQLQ